MTSFWIKVTPRPSVLGQALVVVPSCQRLHTTEDLMAEYDNTNSLELARIRCISGTLTDG